MLLELRKKEISVSDRTFFGFGSIVQAEAFLNGRDEVIPADMLALKNYLWNRPEEISLVCEILKRLCENPLGDRIKELTARALAARNAFDSAADRNLALIKLKTDLLTLYDEATTIKDNLPDGDAAGGNTEADEALLDKVRRNETLKKISVILGRYREILADKRKNGFSYDLGEKYDIVSGCDINNCLSSELALLALPETEILFFKRYYEKGLRQYRRREPSVKGDGDMIVLIDESGSTSGIAPWIKAFALALMDTALHAGKKYALIHFADRNNVKADIFEKGKYTVDDILSAAEHFFGGGTDFEAPLNKALELTENGFEKTDAVIITDGECRISDEFSEKFREAKLKKRITVTGILLDKAAGCGHSLVPFCDKIYRASKLSEEEIALEVFGEKV